MYLLYIVADKSMYLRKMTKQKILQMKCFIQGTIHLLVGWNSVCLFKYRPVVHISAKIVYNV